jgi:hypothetical protein
MICAASSHKHDILFHVIYGNDEKMIVDFIRAGASRLYSLTGCDELNKMVGEIVYNTSQVGINKIRALFFIILNVDMPLKEYICEPNSLDLYAIALGIPKNSNDINLMHSYSMIGTKPMDHGKARRFMLELGDIIRSWLSNETLTLSDLATKVKEEYLVS